MLVTLVSGKGKFDGGECKTREAAGRESYQEAQEECNQPPKKRRKGMQGLVKRKEGDSFNKGKGRNTAT